MELLKDIILLLNPWWKGGVLSQELARPYKRAVFRTVMERLAHRQILILTGLRRVGKTTLLYQAIERLLEDIEPTRLFYFSFDKRVHDLTELMDAFAGLTGTDWKKERVVVCLDEIAKLEDWASQLKLLYDALPNIRFIVSSSSSISLEAEAVRNLAGRYFLLTILPLGFKEYLELRGKGALIGKPQLWEKELRQECGRYLMRGFPEIVGWEDEPLIRDYLRSTIIDKVLKVDMPEHFGRMDSGLLLTLLEIIYSEPGTYLSYDGISRKLGVSKKTLTSHLSYLESSYLLRRVKNYRVSRMATSRKMQRLYPYWWTLAYCYTDDESRILECMVGSALDARHYWREGGKEIDFLLVMGRRVLPVEVKSKIRLDREDLRHLRYFMKRYNQSRGIIVYRGEEMQEGAILAIPPWKFLFSGSWPVAPAAEWVGGKKIQKKAHEEDQ